MNINEIENKNNVKIGKNCDIHKDVTFHVSKSGKVFLGDNVVIGKGTHLESLKNSSLEIGHNVSIGNNCYISAMSKIIIGDEVAISNMVDIHDHNHKDRSIENLSFLGGDYNTSGFEVAPIFIEHGAIISNKVSVTAGVRIGQNCKVGANAVVSKSLPPNNVAVGIPAKPIKQFIGNLKPFEKSFNSLNIGFFGTSIMQHLEAYAPQIYNQMNLPEIGSDIKVVEWRKRGYVKMLESFLTVNYPYISFSVDNFGVGGANTFRIIKEVNKRIDDENRQYDLCFLSGGINDVWRKLQGRDDQAVEIEDFEKNYIYLISKLKKCSRLLICLSETPFEYENNIMGNDILKKYNKIVEQLSKANNIPFIDLWNPFINYNINNRISPRKVSLWADEAHLTELGDILIFSVITDFLRKNKIIEKLSTMDRISRPN